jgi:predicted transposase YbfD/YdcC
MRLSDHESDSSPGDLLSLPDGVPSEDTFERVFKSINSGEAESYGKHMLTEQYGKQIVMDGKKQRAVSPVSRGNRGLYLLNIRVRESRFCIAPKRVEDKSGEITVLPAVPDSTDITDAAVSVDATGVQRETADLTAEKNGHCLLVLKNSRQSLFEDVECVFKMHGGYVPEAGHGHRETRKCSIRPACKFLPEEKLAPWKNQKTLIRPDAGSEAQGTAMQEVRYDIRDEQETEATYFCTLVGRHWSMENRLHRHLDVTFKEKACHVGAGYVSQNLSVLRGMALHIVSEQKDKHSIRKKLYKAALDTGYLKKTLESLMRLPCTLTLKESVYKKKNMKFL